MSKQIASTAADCHRAVALLRAKVTGDEAAAAVHVHDAISQERLENLVAPLVEISANFIQIMIGKGALDGGSFLEWICNLENGMIDAELDEDLNNGD